MKLLVDDRWFGNTGIGRYAFEIINRKPDEIEITSLNRHWKIKNPASPWLLGSAINSCNADVFWSPGFMPPAWCNIPYVVTVHDLIHLHYGTSLHRLYYNQVIRRLLHHSSSIFTDSEYSRNEILAWSGLSSDRVKVISLAVDDSFREEGHVFEPGYPYILYVGNRRVYKNIERLIKAFAIGCVHSEIKLALSGVEDENLIKLASQAGIAERLVFLGNIKEDDLPAVYRGALAVAYISLYEGFGLPPLEAMACGTPVIASNVTSIPEVVGDAALLVDPLEIEEIAYGIRQLTEDNLLRESFRQAGLKRAKMFSWDRTAELTWNVLKEVAK